MVANDAHYPNEEDTTTQDVLLAIQTNTPVNKEDRFSFLGSGMAGLYLKTRSEMIYSFKPWVEEGYFDMEFLSKGFLSTQEIARKCSGLEIPELEFALPSPRSIKDTTETDAIMKLCLSGWNQKVVEKGLDQEKYLKRLKHELNVISKIGAIRYFLIAHDVIDYARNDGIPVGYGRGSAGGSLVAYLLGLTGLDPIEHDLYFERFLREDRIDMPDIDIDFGAGGKDKIIKYVKKLYGDENVCQISVSTIMHGKSAFRDVARVFGMKILDVNKASKAIDPDLTLEENFNQKRELVQVAEQHPQIVKHAIRLDGQLRSKGVHAGGVILSDDGFLHRGVLEKRKDARTINWHMGEVERFGLLKFDFLALNNLSILELARKFIKERTGKDIDFPSITLDDKNVLNQYSEGNTVGLFQFESPGITGICQKLAPIQTFEVLVHINALYRPGPLDSGMVETYINRYKKLEPVSYYHEAETKIMEQTLGLPIFQEMVMRQFVDLAGFTWPEADNMRKLISKSKGVEAIEEKRIHFVKGCEKTVGMKEEIANIIFNNITKFGRYGFNKAHAACYTYLSYLTAWVKTYYPTEFMAALLSFSNNESDQTEKFVNECTRLGIEVKGPNINLSGGNWEIVDDTIIAGFSSVKGVGSIAAQKIVEARRDSPFASFFDFMSRTERAKVNKRVVEAIAYTGGFDPIQPNTKWIIENYPVFVKAHPAVPGDMDLATVTDYEEVEKHSQKAHFAPGVFTASGIEIKADMDIQDDILGMVNSELLSCEACPLSSDEAPIGWKWSSRSKVVMLGQFPNAAEASKGSLFIGKTYTKMWQILKEEADITPGKVLQGHSFSCKPKDGRLHSAITDECICPNLWLPKLVKACSPNVFLAFGNAGVAAFTGKASGIMKLNATTIWHPEYNAMVVFSITPGMMAYDESGEKEEMFREAIRKLKTYL